jgi:predicted KAP-like P-loop ATPase
MRVAAQGLTIVAVVAGTWSMRPKDNEIPGAHSTAPRNDADVEKRRMEKIAKEKEEFEERLRGAERAEGVEAELRARKGAAPAVAAKPEAKQGKETPVDSEGGDGRRWWRWF